MSSDRSMPSMGEDMDVFTMDNTDMPKIDQQDTREELEPDFSPAVRGRKEREEEGLRERWEEKGGGRVGSEGRNKSKRWCI